jgi:hypothetical protein
MAAGYYVVRSGPRRAIWTSTSRMECHCESSDGIALGDISDLVARGLVTPNNKDEDPTHFLVARNPSQPVAVRPQYCRSDLNRRGCPV